MFWLQARVCVLPHKRCEVWEAQDAGGEGELV